MSGNLTQIEQDLRQSSEALQDLRSKYDGALLKIGEANEACKTELEGKKNEALEALEASKSEQGIKIAALEGKMQELKSRFITDDNQILIKVGNNADEGEIASLKEALNLALKYSPSIPQSVTREKNRVVIELQEGWEWVEPIGLYHIDLSHIILTQKNFDVPIMCDFSRENMHADNGLLVKLYLDNSKISIKKLHLKAKQKELTQNACWFNNYIYSRFGSVVFIEHLKLDDSLLTTRNFSQAGGYTIFTDDGSTLLAHKIEIIKSAATNESFSVYENSRAYIEHLILSGGNSNYNGVSINTASSAYIHNITISGNIGHNGVLINTASSAYIHNITISGNIGHNGVLINTASSALIHNITISGNSGHNGVMINTASSACIHNITISGRSAHQHLLVDGARLFSQTSCNFTGGSTGNNQKLAIVRGGLATVAGNGYSRGAGNDANQAVGVWSAHGSWCFYGNRT
ncbi:right-handed parallel beta-helix repeat-containing protein [Campylobacter upsaliensis]|nr:right-handed parallel beta-helix repeat-containing protein [Campylobacter upsaliensis]